MTGNQRRFLGALGLVCMNIICVQAADPLLHPPAAADERTLRFQYESGEIRIPLPTRDEPRVSLFGRETIRSAVEYVEKGALAWVRERGCINCHTTGPYMSEMPAMQEHLGDLRPEVRENFASHVPIRPLPGRLVTKNGHEYMDRSYYAVWRSLGLAEWDQHISGKLSEETDRSLRDMFLKQSRSGAFVSYGEVEVPHVTTDFELTLQAARAVVAAPGWLQSMRGTELEPSIERMFSYLRNEEPANDFDRVLRLQLFHYLPKLAQGQEQEELLQLLVSKQHEDGGWSLRDMSAIDDWHYTISSKVREIVSNLPDAASPQSDPYMTSLAIVLMRQSDVPASDQRIQAGLDWLKQEQRISGRWTMDSLYRGNYNYITYIATVQALKALYLCDELDDLRR